MLSKIESRRNIKTCRKEFAEQMKELRESRGLSIGELSKEAMVPAKFLTKIEGGKFPNLGHLHNLAKFHDRKIRIEFY